jgi:predicted dithiol-disulfide oxidoreductase (DUF899 family)
MAITSPLPHVLDVRRGLDLVLTVYHYRDLTPFGRGEGWGGMPDLDGKGPDWLRYHD